MYINIEYNINDYINKNRMAHICVYIFSVEMMNLLWNTELVSTRRDI